MMKHTLYKLSIIGAALTIAALQSCKKDDDDKSRSELLVGTWNGYQTGLDSNNNGTWELSERRNLPSTANGQSSFNADGTGRLKGDTTLAGVPSTWVLSNNDNDLRIIATFPNMLSDTVDFRVVSLSASELILKLTSDSPSTYTSLIKQ